MNPDDVTARHSSWLRSGAYLLNRWVLRRDFLIARLPRAGLRFRVKTEDVVGRHIYKYHVHEPAVSSMLLSTLAIQPGDVVIDIGAT